MNPLSIHCNRLEHLTDRLLGLGFSRGEFYNFRPEHLPAVEQFIQEHGITPSIHCPLRKAPWYPYPVTWSFLSSDVHYEEREMSFKLIEEALHDARHLKATYVIVHYPTPASLRAGEITVDKQYEIAWDSARRLSDLAEVSETPIHIEGFGPSPFLSLDFLGRVLNTFGNLRYCFDTGHTQLAARRDGLDYFSFLEALSPYIGSVHVWNTRGITDYQAYHHLPPHPQLSPADGWIDFERVVTTVRQANPSAVFVLEYSESFPPESGLDYREGVAWFKHLVTSALTGASPERNIVLTGFMATGKTQVGRAVADRLGRTFVDMDEVLESRFGMTIARLFEQRGEAFFREQESLLCQELATQTGLVIATGGGALVSETNRQTLARNGILICIQCEPDEILRRVGQAQERPMLWGAELQERVETLLAKRRSAYAAIPHQIDTTHVTVEQVADQVVALWRNGRLDTP